MHEDDPVMKRVRFAAGRWMLLALVGLGLTLLLGGCGGAAAPTPSATLEPGAMIEQTISGMRAQTTFDLNVSRTGAEYFIETDLGSLRLDRAEGQYIAPDQLGIQVQVAQGRLAIVAEVFAQGSQQFVRAIFTRNQWTPETLVDGFNAADVLSTEDNGFARALRSLQQLTLVGEADLDDGTPVYHLTAEADGPQLSALVVNLITMDGPVGLNLYLRRADLLPARFVATQIATASDPAGPTTWTIDVFNYGAAARYSPPEIEATSEATAEG
jgi:hypothetical protein